MSRALVVGSGMVGSEIARDLSRLSEFSRVTVVDASRDNLSRVESFRRIRTVRGDVFNGSLLGKLLTEADLVCGALPGRLGYELMRRVVEHGTDFVDISYTPEDPYRLSSLARKYGSILVPQCGVAPGLSNICVGNAASKLKSVRSVKIFVGGLPQHPIPPLNYQFVFSPDDVINEYTRDVSIVRNGRITRVPPLSGRGEFHFPPVGKLEYFLTDGLGTLTQTFGRVAEMGEYTLRYPGHANIMDSLRVLGLLDKKPVKVNGAIVEPRGLVLERMKPLMGRPERGDLLAFRVEVEGKSADGRARSINYRMIDFYNPHTRASAMARTTAYTCTAVARLVVRKLIRTVGLVPPEDIGRDPNLFRSIRSHLARHGVKLCVGS